MRAPGLAAWLAGALVLVMPTTAVAACGGAGAIPMQGKPDAPFEVSILRPETIPISAPFQADVAICAAGAAKPGRVTLDATMPAHKHGMNYKPEISAIAEGRYEVNGLLFHMPGVWRFEVTAYQDGKPFRFSHEVQVQ